MLRLILLISVVLTMTACEELGLDGDTPVNHADTTKEVFEEKVSTDEVPPVEEPPVEEPPVEEPPVEEPPTAENGVCDFGPLGATGNVYYICDCQAGADSNCVAGNDNNSGTDPNNPKKTYDGARSRFTSMNAGDTVAFCFGGSFNRSGTNSAWVNNRCKMDQTCYIRAYTAPWASGDEKKPIINSKIDFIDGGNADHEEGYKVENIDLKGDHSGYGIYIYNDMDYVTVCNIISREFDIGFHIAGSNSPNAGSDGKNSDIILKNSQILNNDKQGFLGGCTRCQVLDNYFEGNGNEGTMFNHQVYFSNANGATVGGRIIGNTLYKSSMINGKCNGTPMVGHGEHEDLIIEGNTLRQDPGTSNAQCWGIGVSTGYSDAEYFRRLQIRNNTVINMGSVSISTNACQDCIIENNLVIQENTFGNNAAVGIMIPDRNRGSADTPLINTTIRNNTIYYGPTVERAMGIFLGGEGTGHRSFSNSVYYGNSDSRLMCYSYNLPLSNYSTIDYNHCYHPNTSSYEWVKNYGGINNWKSSSTFDQNSHEENPQFISIQGPWTNYNFKVSSETSPLIDAGHPTSSSTYSIEETLRDESPDIGAFEY